MSTTSDKLKYIFKSIGSYDEKTINDILNKLSDDEKETFLLDNNVQDKINEMIKVDEQIKTLPTGDLSSENKKLIEILRENLGFLQGSIILNKISSKKFITQLIKLMNQKIIILTSLLLSEKYKQENKSSNIKVVDTPEIVPLDATPEIVKLKDSSKKSTEEEINKKEKKKLDDKIEVIINQMMTFIDQLYNGNISDSLQKKIERLRDEEFYIYKDPNGNLDDIIKNSPMPPPAKVGEAWLGKKEASLQIKRRRELLKLNKILKDYYIQRGNKKILKESTEGKEDLDKLNKEIRDVRGELMSTLDEANKGHITRDMMNWEEEYTKIDYFEKNPYMGSDKLFRRILDNLEFKLDYEKRLIGIVYDKLKPLYEKRIRISTKPEPQPTTNGDLPDSPTQSKIDVAKKSEEHPALKKYLSLLSTREKDSEWSKNFTVGGKKLEEIYKNNERIIGDINGYIDESFKGVWTSEMMELIENLRRMDYFDRFPNFKDDVLFSKVISKMWNEGNTKYAALIKELVFDKDGSLKYWYGQMDKKSGITDLTDGTYELYGMGKENKDKWVEVKINSGRIISKKPDSFPGIKYLVNHKKESKSRLLLTKSYGDAEEWKFQSTENRTPYTEQLGGSNISSQLNKYWKKKYLKYKYKYISLRNK
jgi:hypothetical protein